MSTFDLQCFYNEFLAQGQGEVDAIVTVAASGAGSQASTAGSPRRHRRGGLGRRFRVDGRQEDP